MTDDYVEFLQEQIQWFDEFFVPPTKFNLYPSVSILTTTFANN